MRRSALKTLATNSSEVVPGVVVRLLYSNRLRPIALRLADSVVGSLLDESRAPANERKIVQQRRAMARAAMASIERSAARRFICPSVMKRTVELWTKALVPGPRGLPGPSDFEATYHRDPPWFIAISPGSLCDLRCAGCYANSDGHGKRLYWNELNRVVDDARSLWGIRVVVLSGGEPLLYESDGNDVISLAERHPDLMFLMFTNGTHFTDSIAERLAITGNLTPAFSVEGMREPTDLRRGAGTFDKVIASARRAAGSGVPFGVSATLTSDSIDNVLSDEFLDLFFRELGAFYAFFFPYAPMGREPDLGLIPTPEQRLRFWSDAWRVIEEKRHLLIDFANHGPIVKGCISAGKSGGYLHVDWNGNVMPCVFVPYSAGNVRDVYERGGTLNDIWEAPLLHTIRRWQESYGQNGHPGSPHGNWLRPCPFRDHHRLFRKWVMAHTPTPEEQVAGDILEDEEFQNELARMADDFRQLSDPIWQREYSS